MKKIILILCIITFYSYKVNAQNTGKKDSLGNALRNKLSQLNTIDDYSNFKEAPQGRAFTENILNGQKIASTIVIIDDKIYKLDSKEYLELNNNDLAESGIEIKDATSPTNIKRVLIFKTKKKIF